MTKDKATGKPVSRETAQIVRENAKKPGPRQGYWTALWKRITNKGQGEQQ